MSRKTFVGYFSGGWTPYVLGGWLFLSAGALVAADEPPGQAEVAGAPQSGGATDEISDAELDAFLVEEEDDKTGLHIYGFGDFSYTDYLVEKGSGWNVLLDRFGDFYVGNLNVYLDSTIRDRLRALTEIRFTYLPHGSRNTPQGRFDYVNNQVLDYNDFHREFVWGAIEIERAWVEYRFADWAKLRAGQWLTPYGIWNVDHGAPAIIAVRRPFILGEQMFPERQTGFQFLGSVNLQGIDFGYHLTISNGRGPYDAYNDLDSNMAVGGRLFATLHHLGILRLGVSAYRGRYTDRLTTVGAQNQQLVAVDKIPLQYDEQSLAIDLKWEFKNFHLASEIIINEVAYTDVGRPVSPVLFGTTTQLRPDGRRQGGYGLVGYRLPWFRIMPFALYEYFDNFDDDFFPKYMFTSAGINSRPFPELVVKVQYSRANFPDAPPNTPGNEPVAGIDLQIAWVF